MMSKEFTLVSTVFNEFKRLDQTIHDIEWQTVRPAQIVIADAGSTDGTFQALVDWSKSSAIEIVVLEAPGCNVAEGRNLAIKHAKYDLIVSTDFGCRFHQQWLESILAAFSDPSVEVVGGAFTVDEDTIHSLPSRANYVLTNGYKTDLDDSFIPSSRSIAYYKHVWEAVGGYSEWLTLAADDLVFGKALKAKAYEIMLVKNPYVYWGRHQTLKGYVRESYRYGLGDGEARVNRRNAISNFAELVLRYLLFLSLVLFTLNSVSSFISDVFFIFSIVFLPGLRSYSRTVCNWWSLRSPRYGLCVLLYSFLLLEFTRLNYIRGYLKGFLFSKAVVRKHARTLATVLR